MATVYHVSLEDGHWKVLKEGAKRALRRFDAKQDAIDFANTMARDHKPCELILHVEDGTPRLRYRFG